MITEQELGLHLIARYLLTSDRARASWEMSCETLFTEFIRKFGIPRIANTSIESDRAYKVYDFVLCVGCRSCVKNVSSYMFTSSCLNCREFHLHSQYKADWLNRYYPLVPNEYKLKLEEILWQTYLRRLL